MSKNKETKNAKSSKSLLIGLISTMIIVLVALLIYILTSKVSTFNNKREMMNQYREALKSSELSLIYYMHTGCQFCALQEPILEQISKDYELEYVTLDSTKLSKKDNKEVLDTLNIEGRTPTLVVVKDGEVTATHVGYLEGHKLVEFFVKAELLDEKSTYKPEENLKFIEHEEFEEIKKEKEIQAVILGAATCDYCKAVRPILSDISKAYNLPIYYLGLDYLTKEESNNFKKELKDMGYNEKKLVEEGTYTTPSVLLIKNGKVISYITGYQETSDYVKYFKEQKLIKG